MNVHRLYRPFLRRFRTKRMRQFCNLFEITETSRILDVGGDFFNWSLISTIPSLTMVNLYFPKESKGSAIWVVADGRHLPFKNGAFEIAYSNSVIEHLGTSVDQRAFAREIDRVGFRYYVQTPNKRFPVEPHLLTPFIHWLPRSIQRRLLRNFTVWGLVARPSEAECDRFMTEIQLLDIQDMRAHFPQAHILSEKVLGITKSLIAVK